MVMTHKGLCGRILTAFLLFSLAGTMHTQTAVPLSKTYKPVADQLIAASLADYEGYANLAYLCDHIGKRISGSESLNQAIAWAAELMRKQGLANVHTQAATVPHWVRGEESGEIVSPVSKKLHMLGLGMSVATPSAGLTAEVVVVPDFAALDALGKTRVQGRIVVFNAPYEGYGRTVMYRTAGPSRAAALGAVAVLVRSITPLAVQLPHTGTTQYDEAQPKIPPAAIGGQTSKGSSADAGAPRNTSRRGQRDGRDHRFGASGADRRARRAHRFLGCRTGRAGRWFRDHGHASRGQRNP